MVNKQLSIAARRSLPGPFSFPQQDHSNDPPTDRSAICAFVFVVGLYEIGAQIFVFLKSFALRARRLPRAGGAGAEKNQRDRDCINDDHREPDGSGPLLLDHKVKG